MNQKKRIALIAVLVVALIAVFAGVWLSRRPQTSQGSKTVTVEVVHKDGSSKTFTYHTDAEYLGEVLTAEGLIQGSDGMYTVVDGETASWEEDQAYWAFYVGDEYAQQGIDQTPVADGDAFSLIYTAESSNG